MVLTLLITFSLLAEMLIGLVPTKEEIGTLKVCSVVLNGGEEATTATCNRYNSVPPFPHYVIASVCMQFHANIFLFYFLFLITYFKCFMLLNCDVLKSYTGEESALDITGQLFQAMADIPRCAQR